MRFYYISVFSVFLWFIYCAIAVPFVWFVLKGIEKRKFGQSLALGSAVVVAALPWLEEWWIAFEFGRMCRRDAGVSVYRTAKVDGFYDDTGAGSLALVSSGQYQFVEGRRTDGTFTRLSPGDAQFMQRAVERYRKAHPQKEIVTQNMIQVAMDERTEALVFPEKKQSWRITRLDKLSARYHYKSLSTGTPVAHQITRGESVVLDSHTGEVMGRLVDYGRGAYWFYIGLGRPTISCEETREGTAKHGSLIYRAVLQPSKSEGAP